MNPLPRPKGPSVWPNPPIRPGRKPLRVILNGLGKDAAHIISRINGFTHVITKFDYNTGLLEIVKETPYSKGEAGRSQMLRRR